MNLDHTFSKLTFTIDTMEDYLKVKKLFLRSASVTIVLPLLGEALKTPGV
jgi:hypothetical protein